jgi:hypothetical protein
MTSKEKFRKYFPDASNKGASVSVAHRAIHERDFDQAGDWIWDYFTSGVSPVKSQFDFIVGRLAHDHGVNIQVEGVALHTSYPEDYVIPKDGDYKNVKVTVIPDENSEIDHDF